MLTGEGIRLAEVARAAIDEAVRRDRDPRARELSLEIQPIDFSEWARGAAAAAIQGYVLGGSPAPAWSSDWPAPWGGSCRDTVAGRFTDQPPARRPASPRDLPGAQRLIFAVECQGDWTWSIPCEPGAIDTDPTVWFEADRPVPELEPLSAGQGQAQHQRADHQGARDEEQAIPAGRSQQLPPLLRPGPVLDEADPCRGPGADRVRQHVQPERTDRPRAAT